MRAVIQRASRAETKTDKEKILQAFGLHDIQVCSNRRVGFVFKNIIRSILSGSFDFPTHMLPAATTPSIRMS
jgi:hypothetical protein